LASEQHRFASFEELLKFIKTSQEMIFQNTRRLLKWFKSDQCSLFSPQINNQITDQLSEDESQLFELYFAAEGFDETMVYLSLLNSDKRNSFGSMDELIEAIRSLHKIDQSDNSSSILQQSIFQLLTSMLCTDDDLSTIIDITGFQTIKILQSIDGKTLKFRSIDNLVEELSELITNNEHNSSDSSPAVSIQTALKVYVIKFLSNTEN